MLRVTRSSIGLSLVLLLLFGTRPLVADQISACVNPAGQMRLVASGASCRPQEELVTWNVQGPEGPEGPQGPQGPEGDAASGAGPAVVLDSNDTIVGRYLNRTGDVLVHIGADFFVASATQLGFIPAGTFIHQQADCTDTPFVTTVNPNALAQAALVKPGEAWLPDLAAAKVNPPANSVAFAQTFFASGPPTPCMGPFASPATLTPLRSVSLSGFLTPFRIE